MNCFQHHERLNLLYRSSIARTSMKQIFRSSSQENTQFLAHGQVNMGSSGNVVPYECKCVTGTTKSSSFLNTFDLKIPALPAGDSATVWQSSVVTILIIPWMAIDCHSIPANKLDPNQENFGYSITKVFKIACDTALLQVGIVQRIMRRLSTLFFINSFYFLLAWWRCF